MAAEELFPASLAAHSFLLLPVGRTGAAGFGATVTASELLAAYLGTLRSARRRLVTADSHLVLATGVRDEHRHTAADLFRNGRQMALPWTSPLTAWPHGKGSGTGTGTVPSPQGSPQTL